MHELSVLSDSVHERMRYPFGPCNTSILPPLLTQLDSVWIGLLPYAATTEPRACSRSSECSLSQDSNTSKTGTSVLPNSVSEYATRGIPFFISPNSIAILSVLLGANLGAQFL
jgi:hypothetical protein